MSYTNKLEYLIAECNGIITTKIISKAGIPRVYIKEFTKRGVLRRIDRGIYISKNYCADDEMCLFQTKYEQAIFSHNSALFLYGFLDEKPSSLTVTVKTGVNTKNLINNGAKVHSIKEELYLLGANVIKNEYGNDIRTYNVERAICDIIRNRSKMEFGTIIDVLKKYNNANKDFACLIKYAEQFRVAKILKNYLEFF